VLEKAYDPKAVEDRIYKMWEDSGVFQADASSKKEPFTISMPPPNATGTLHLGHASMLALQDIFIRFARMQGKEALWVPGTDHAAIATESVVIKKIQKEEKIKDPRTHYGRETLVKRIAEFTEDSRSTIRSQVRKMGSSCDWSREAYTMDPALNRCVNEVFKSMYEDGLIYRGERVVNWDTALQTTISDDEIVHEEQNAVLYTLEYVPASETGGEPIYVATSRPETKLADNALVVHPDDERYKQYIGKTFTVSWPRGQQIRVTIIADHTVDPAFGTGVLGLTPFHSKIDYEIWQRHKAGIEAAPFQAIGEDGKMTDKVQGYAGMTVEEARAAFVEDLKAEGRLKEEKPYVQPLALSYRSKKPVEALPKLQWFIDVNKKVVQWKGKMMSLKEVMQAVVGSNEDQIKIIPDRFEKTYFHWIDNLQDWCISRQIWWGHRVPVWYKGDETYVGVTAPEGKGWTQDEDTLDTWFSSALWTWSTLIDPALTDKTDLSLKDLLAQSPDFQKFHPTHVMETGYDILFFWVARMILMTTYATGQIPFKTVYLHGLIRTRDGKKMSKSDPSTIIDPLDMIATYGADALRLSMIVGQSPGNDSRLYEEKIEGYRNFVNKLWNASRFVLMQCEQAGVDPKNIIDIDLNKASETDKAILSILQHQIDHSIELFNLYFLSQLGEELYGLVWNTFCDWYLELSKSNSNPEVLVYSIRTILKLLHPFCPFVTEELWAHFKSSNNTSLISESWPISEDRFRFDAEQARFMNIIALISNIRSAVPEEAKKRNAKPDVFVYSPSFNDLFLSRKEDIVRLAKLNSLTINLDKQDYKDALVIINNDTECYILYKDFIDINERNQNLKKEKDNLLNLIKMIEMKLENEQFVEKAPAKLVEEQRLKLNEAKENLLQIELKLEGTTESKFKR